MNKPKVAIFEFTDCEGCQVELVGLGERLVEIADQVDIVVWRLGQERAEPGPYDIAIIEGTPMSKEERETLKWIRKQSKQIIGLGTCATLGGIPAIMDEKKRDYWYKKIYGPQYKPRGIDALPLSAFVEVDFPIHGCPINGDEVVRIIQEILVGKKPQSRNYSVCFECKQAKNPCRLLEKKPCLGPITQGGCRAVCISGGSACWGCFGLREGADVDGLLNILFKISDSDEVERYFSMFLKRTEAYQQFSSKASKISKGNKDNKRH